MPKKAQWVIVFLLPCILSPVGAPMGPCVQHVLFQSRPHGLPQSMAFGFQSHIVLVFGWISICVLDGFQSGPISTWILDGCQFEPTSIWLLDGFRFGPFSIWEGTAKNVATVQTYCMLLDFVNGDQPNFDSCQRGRLVSSSISRPSSRLFLKTEMMLHITQTLAHHVFSKLGNMAIPFRPSVILLSDQVRGLAP